MMPTSKMTTNYLIAICLGISIGFRIIPPIVTGIIYTFLIVKAFYHCLKLDLKSVFITLPYIIYLEVFVRAYVRFLPYLSVQYLLIFGIGYLFFFGNKKVNALHFKSVFLIVFYFIVEVLNGFLSASPQIAYSLQVQTLTLVVVSLWAAFNKLSEPILNLFMDHIRIATVFLAGIVLVAHFQGKIDYGTASSNHASNGLAPVQLSGYFGTGLSLILISVLNSFDKRSKIIQLIAFSLVAVIMVLTFSRGGVYFVGFVTLIYLFNNRTQFGNYFKFIILVPIGLLLFNFIVSRTDGKVFDRYEEKGASNREKLVLIAFTIFAENPLIGIGTGNYNSFIKDKKLFYVDAGVHNEFARAAAEHGILGILLYWSFFIGLLINIFKRQRPARDFALYFFALFFLITIHNGLKISVQPILLLLSIGISPPVIKKSKSNLIYVENIK